MTASKRRRYSLRKLKRMQRVVRAAVEARSICIGRVTVKATILCAMPTAKTVTALYMFPASASATHAELWPHGQVLQHANCSCSTVQGVGALGCAEQQR